MTNMCALMEVGLLLSRWKLSVRLHTFFLTITRYILIDYVRGVVKKRAKNLLTSREGEIEYARNV